MQPEILQKMKSRRSASSNRNLRKELSPKQGLFLQASSSAHLGMNYWSGVCCGTATGDARRGKQASRRGPRRAAGGVFFKIHALIYVRKPSNKVRLHSSRTSKRRVSCLGMSWRRNELITLTLPKSGVARTVCYVDCFVQPTANTTTCLPINN